jgi:predicted porin
MKKSLLAVAAVTAFTGAAQAQSSVTVYGIIDMGYGAAQNNTTTDGTVVKATASTTGSESNQSSSRLGFRGSEDLGGGTSAVFTLEMGINAFGDKQSTTSLNSRVAFVGLQDKTLGTVLLGRQYQSLHTVIGNGSAGAQNNVAGNIYSGASSGGTLANNSNIRPYAVYNDNAITYVSPSFSGVTLEVQTSHTNTTTSETSGTTSVSDTGASLKYAGVKNLSVAYGYTQSAAVTAKTSNVRTTAQALSANYNFGVAQAFLLGTQTKVDNLSSGVNFSDLKMFEAGIKVPVTPKIGVFASMMSGNIGSATNGAALAAYNFTAAMAHADVSGYQLGATYDFSKRTNLYAIYGTQSIKGKDAAVNDKLATSQYALGVRHTF